MTRYRVTVEGRVYDVDIEDPTARPVTAKLGGTAYVVEIADDAATADAPPESGAEAGAPREGIASATEPSDTEETAAVLDGEQSLTAPIPGVVSSIEIKTGDVVKRGDELLTIEAMKMFNVIRSPWSATIATIHTAAGKRVSQGAPLVTFRPT